MSFGEFVSHPRDVRNRVYGLGDSILCYDRLVFEKELLYVFAQNRDLADRGFKDGKVGRSDRRVSKEMGLGSSSPGTTDERTVEQITG